MHEKNVGSQNRFFLKINTDTEVQPAFHPRWANLPDANRRKEEDSSTGLWLIIEISNNGIVLIGEISE